METKFLIELGGRELGVVFLYSNGTCDLFLFQILFIFGTDFCMSNSVALIHFTCTLFCIFCRFEMYAWRRGEKRMLESGDGKSILLASALLRL